MGKFLDRTYAIWSNPEQAYKEHGGSKSRREFFAEMCGVTDKGHQLDFIKAKVLRQYDDDPDRARSLQLLLDAIAKNWHLVDDREVLDLNSYIRELVIHVNEEPDVDITADLDPYVRTRVPQVNYAFMAEKYSFLGDLILEDKDGRPVVYQVPEFEPDTNIFIYKGAKSLDVLRTAGLNSEFLQKVFFCADYINETQAGVPSHSIFVGRPFFRKSGDIYLVSVDKSKIVCNPLDEQVIRGVKVIICRNLERMLPTTVYCLT